MRKNKTVLAILLVLAIAMASVSAASFATANIDWTLYGGINLHQYSLKGFKDTRLSDYPKYSVSQEGSLLLPLGNQNGSGVGFGATVGTRGNLSDSFDAIAEVTVSMAGQGGLFVNGSVGAVYNFMNAKFRVGVGGKVGYYMYSKSLGTAQTLPGTVPPVKLSDTDVIKNGDSLSYSASGISATPILDMSMRVSRNIAVGAQIGYQFCIPLTSALNAKSGNKNVNISPKKYPNAYYEADTTALKPMEFDPKASVNGFTGTLYCSYVF